MLTNANFSPREWDLAPQYRADEAQGAVIPLDFQVLGDMAAAEEAKGAFRTGSNGTMAMAPLRLGHLPAAFLKVTNHPEFIAEHMPSENETLVVLDGALKVEPVDNSRQSWRQEPAKFMPGTALNIKGGAKLSLEALGVFDPVQCLAVAVYHDAELDPGSSGVPILRPRR